MSVELNFIKNSLDDFFQLAESGVDPAMSRFVPDVYKAIGFDWFAFFEPGFGQFFNGLMIRGGENVSKIFCSVFPTEEVLDIFIEKSQPGDLLFLHHPITMECGDPRGKAGRGFLPIPISQLERIKSKGLSIYSCHAPLDANREIGTNEAIIQALSAKTIGEFLPYGDGYAGRICEITPLSTIDLINKLLKIFHIPYVDESVRRLDKISRIAIVAGSGDNIEYFQEAEARGAQAYIAGEIHSHIDNEKGRTRLAEAQAYIAQSPMSFIGVSHAASEYLVMETQMRDFFQDRFGLETVMIPLPKWWI